MRGPKAADALEGLGEQLAVEDGRHGAALLVPAGAVEVDGADEAIVDAGQLGFNAAGDVLGGQPAQQGPDDADKESPAGRHDHQQQGEDAQGSGDIGDGEGGAPPDGDLEAGGGPDRDDEVDERSQYEGAESEANGKADAGKDPAGAQQRRRCAGSADRGVWRQATARVRHRPTSAGPPSDSRALWRKGRNKFRSRQVRSGRAGECPAPRLRYRQRTQGWETWWGRSIHVKGY